MFMGSAVVLWGLTHVFRFVSSWELHQATALTIAGTAIYAAHFARNVWLDFRTSQDVVAGYISQALISGGTIWWLFVCLQFFIVSTSLNQEVKLMLGIVAVPAYFLAVLRKMPAPLHTYSAATKMRMFVPKLFAAYLVTPDLVRTALQGCKLHANANVLYE